MNFSLLICSVVLVLMLARWGVELWLRGLNRRHVLAHANAVPDAFKGSIDDATYARSVQYTLAKSKFSQIVLFDTLIQQLAEPELEAVLAHEIGHYKKRHVPKMLAGSGAALLLGFFLLADPGAAGVALSSVRVLAWKHCPGAAALRVA